MYVDFLSHDIWSFLILVHLYGNISFINIYSLESFFSPKIFDQNFFFFTKNLSHTLSINSDCDLQDSPIISILEFRIKDHSLLLCTHTFTLQYCHILTLITTSTYGVENSKVHVRNKINSNEHYYKHNRK